MEAHLDMIENTFQAILESFLEPQAFELLHIQKNVPEPSSNAQSTQDQTVSRWGLTDNITHHNKN